MAKKSKVSLNFIFLIGMALIIIGFCVPLFFYKMPGGDIKAGNTLGFDLINFDRDSSFSLGALLIFLGGCLGAVIELVCVFVKKIKPSLKVILELLCVVLSVVGGLIVFIKFNDNNLTKFIGKGFFKHAFVGIYMIIAGWVVGLLGSFIKK